MLITRINFLADYHGILLYFTLFKYKIRSTGVILLLNKFPSATLNEYTRTLYEIV